MKKRVVSCRSNLRVARNLWGQLSRITEGTLRELTVKFSLSVAAGDLQLLNGRWYVTHSGLLQLASRRGCRGINTMLQDKLSDLAAGRWVFKAVVYKSRPLERLCRLWRRRSFERFFHGAWRRVAHCRNSSRQPRPAQGLRDRPLLGRRVRCVLERAATLRGFLAVERTFLQWKWQRPASAPRSALPFDPPVQPRCESRESLCGGLLRHRHTQRRQP